jgi:hypothetical protein
MPATAARGMVRHSGTVQPEAAPPAFGKPAGLRADSRYAEPLAEAPQYAPPREKVGLLARMPSFLRRSVEPEPELVEPVLAEDLDLDDMPDDDRIKARISSVIRARTRAPEETLSPIAAAIQRREPSLTRPACAANPRFWAVPRRCRRKFRRPTPLPRMISSPKANLRWTMICWRMIWTGRAIWMAPTMQTSTAPPP